MAFIVFEGLDGAGKSTLTQLLLERLRSLNQEVILTREPGGTDLGEEIRQMLLRTKGVPPTPRTELLLYEAARAQHVDELILPSLKAGKWVLCDRFVASSVAFQSAGRNLSKEKIDWLNDFATNTLLPDLTVLLDLPVSQSMKRIEERVSRLSSEKDRFEIEPVPFHEAVRRSYLQQAKEAPTRWLVIDAQKPPAESFELLLAKLKEKKWLES